MTPASPRRPGTLVPLVLVLAGLLGVRAPAAEARTEASSRLPPSDRNLVLEAPIRTWDEALPLGNGLLGGLLWGEGSTLRLSLDRGDLWDERPATGVRWKDFNYATMIRLVAEGKNDELNAIFDRPYSDPHPTKIPAGRFEIALPTSLALERFELRLATAEGRARCSGGAEIGAFFSAAAPVALLRVPDPGLRPESFRLVPPESVRALGYPSARAGDDDGARWFVQEAAGGLVYCALVAWRREGDATLLAVTVASSVDGPDPLAVARERTAAALAAGWEGSLRPHVAWWADFWSRSSVTIPEAEILRHYYLVQYFYGAASRRGAPPMPLQGVWTADGDGLPPWKGDYHNDLNTQMTYISYQAAGRFEEGLSFLDYLWDLLPVFRKFAKDFYAAPGAAVPGVMSLAGQALGGWGHYSLSPTMGAWNAHLFWLHWRYTRDDAFLRERAYPWCREIGQCLLHLLRPDDAGRLVLPLSTSPEIHDNSARAWLTPNTNYDLACVKMLFLALAEMSGACGEEAEAGKWAEAAGKLGGFHVRDDGTLKLCAKTDLPGSHRHLSNLMPIHPFHLITIDGGERDRAIIAASVKEWDRFGTSAWCGYSFSWMSCLRARAGDAEAAVRNLDLFVKAFILRNGFHANGDQTGSGLSSFTYRPFTLEGNFLAAQAVHEMLLQSWGSRPGTPDDETIRVFPATPWRWHDASFEDLRAEGGHRVSARRERNATVWVRIVAGKDGTVRLRDPFGGRAPRWSRDGVRKVGGDFEVSMRKGEVLEASAAAPVEAPPPPADLAEPFKVSRTAIRPNRLPLRIGADSNGGSRFPGDIARVRVIGRSLSPEEVAALARPVRSPEPSGCLVALDFETVDSGTLSNSAVPRLGARIVGEARIVEAEGGPAGKALRLDGKGFVEIAHDPALDCPDGVTLAAWIRPETLPPSGARLIDKSPVGAATAYLLDTYPGRSLRAIVRDPHAIHDARLPEGAWTHVAATVDGATGRIVLYLDGKAVKTESR